MPAQQAPLQALCPKNLVSPVSNAMARLDHELWRALHFGGGFGGAARKAHESGALDDKLASLAKPKLLIIDELGYYLPFDPNAAHRLVSRHYERSAILLTPNRSVGEWAAVFGDPVMATAILDRLLHHSAVVTIGGDSYRLKERRRAGLLHKQSAAPELQSEKTK
jgi:IstB-like ATP binding protein